MGIHGEPEWRTVGTVVRSVAVNGRVILTIALDKDDIGLRAHEVDGGVVVGDHTLGSVLGRHVAPRFNGHQIHGYVEITVWADNWAPGVAEATAPQFADQLVKVRVKS